MKKFLLGLLIFLVGAGFLLLIIIIPGTQILLSGIAGWVMGLGISIAILFSLIDYVLEKMK